jgi:hypothetical protein
MEIGGIMREISFRAWDKVNWKMSVCAGFLSGQVIIIEEDGTVTGKKDDDFILMQFTGIKDRNGKEVYEGDLVMWVDIVESVEYIEENGEYLPFGSHDCAWEGKECEIIGNIYENPELIK